MSKRHEHNEVRHHHVGPFGKKIFGTNGDDDILDRTIAKRSLAFAATTPFSPAWQ